VARQPTSRSSLQAAGLEIDVVVYDEQRLRFDLEEASRRRNRTSASRPENFSRQRPSSRRASSSTTSQPTLWRVRSYSRPGLPSPTTSRSSVEAGSPRRNSRTT
jgi:hypothetical protein